MVYKRCYNIIVSAFDDAGLDHGEYAAYYVELHLKKSSELKNALKDHVQGMQAFADFQEHVTKTYDAFSTEIDEFWDNLSESFEKMAQKQARDFVDGKRDSEDEDDSEIECCRPGDDDDYDSASEDSSSDEEK